MLPPRRILAAVDVSPASQAALTFAERLARRCGAELHVVHAVAPPLPPNGDAATLRQRLCEQLQRAHPSLETAVTHPDLFHIVEGDAGDVVVHVAGREQADLIVIGAHAKGQAEAATPGATLKKVLETSPVAVLAVPDTWTPPALNDLHGVGPVIAALNVTCPAIEGASAAGRLAATLGTSVVLLHAAMTAEKGRARRTTGATSSAAVFDGAMEEVALVATALRAHSPVPLELMIETGDVFSVLAGAAEQHPHALFVLGRGVATHAYGPPCSIAIRLLHSSRVPVLLHVCR